MIQEQRNEEQEHEERETEVYSISDAIHELEVDLRYNKQFPNRDERTDIIRIHGGLSAPSLIINKTQCIKWMREHFQQEPTQPSKHWEKEGQLYVSIRRSPYWVWVSCGENRFRTEQSQAGIQAGENARDEIFATLEGDE